MANCPKKGLSIGGATILRVARGCDDQAPDLSDYLRLGALTDKGFDGNLEAITSNADDIRNLTESVVTGADPTISFSGEVKSTGSAGSESAFALAKEIFDEIIAGRQPSYWVQLDLNGDGKNIIQCYMVFTSWSMAFPTKEVATYEGELKVSTADTWEWLSEEVVVQGVSVTPTTLSVKEGEKKTFTVSFQPVDATNKAYTAASDKPATATASQLMNVVTVTGAAAGTANVTVTSDDGAKTAKCVVTVTAA